MHEGESEVLCQHFYLIMKREKKILYWFFSPLHLWTNTALQVDIKRALKVRARPRLQACSNPQALTSPAPRCAASTPLLLLTRSQPAATPTHRPHTPLRCTEIHLRKDASEILELGLFFFFPFLFFFFSESNLQELTPAPQVHLTRHMSPLEVYNMVKIKKTNK